MKREKIVDLCIVLDATMSNQSIFTGMIDQFGDITFDLMANTRHNKYNYGAVIYRDPVDYKEAPQKSELDEKTIEELKEQVAKEKKRRIEKLKATGMYDEEFELLKEENARHFDKTAYPINKNVPIQFSNDYEKLVSELMKVECDGGNDMPEDWVGALQTALYELKWHEESRKCIIWISDANAHGKRFCGFDNHNEEEPKMEPLVRRLAEEKIDFIGINVIKSESNNGCHQTLQEMKTMYESFLPPKDTDQNLPSFIIEEFKADYDANLYGENDWPNDVIDDFMATVSSSLKKINFE